MQFSDGLLLILSSLGIAQSLFFSFYLVTFEKRKRVSTSILSVLLLMLAVRLAKSLIYNFFDLDQLLMNFGYAAHAAIGPLLLLYLNSFRGENAKFRLGWLLHFIPSIAIVLASKILHEQFWLPTGYSILLYYTAVYLALCWKSFSNQRRILTGIELRWLIVLTSTITVFWFAYFSNFVLRLTPYIAAPLIFSAAIYFVSFIGFRYYSDIFGLVLTVRRSNPIDRSEAEPLVQKLMELLKERKLFLDPDLSLSSLSRDMNISPHKLSQLINDEFCVSFSELINRYRIEDATLKLRRTDQKIAVIAFESGFNTLSAFNAAFKKVTSKTPSEFRKETCRS